jgi:hypothetical protein
MELGGVFFCGGHGGTEIQRKIENGSLEEKARKWGVD